MSLLHHEAYALMSSYYYPIWTFYNDQNVTDLDCSLISAVGTCNSFMGAVADHEYGEVGT